MISAYHAKYYAHELTGRHATDGVNRLSQSLFDASVDLNPHQIDAALFALRNPLQEGVLLADEVGLGKTIGTAVLDDLGLGDIFEYPKFVKALEQSFWMQSFGDSNFVVLDYFDTVLKPRVQKVVFSAGWANGKPTEPETGISHCFKVLKLESYEDTLNNLQLHRSDAQGELLSKLPQQATNDYLLHYMLDVESRGSLLSVADFRKPFDCSLNIAVDSAGASERRKIDLVETFNYLIGLRVKHIDTDIRRGFATVKGTLPSGETCMVLWRDCDKWSFDSDEAKGVRSVTELCDKLAINPKDNEFDVVYINCDHNIPTVLTLTDEEGGTRRVLKLRQIEPEFLERMFSVEDV